jgi:hypothetical protein
MEFVDIVEGSRVFPGEYLFHKTSKKIVVCGYFNLDNKIIKALDSGKLIKGDVSDFQKIQMSKKEIRDQKKDVKKRGCGSCKKR